MPIPSVAGGERRRRSNCRICSSQTSDPELNSLFVMNLDMFSSLLSLLQLDP
jgi:hypothetical protein